jgi:hypothetical protein
MIRARLIAACLAFLSAFAVPAAAQLRSIPPQAKPGTISHVQDMYVSIDGARRRLAPGAQIRDANNRLVLPTSIPPGSQMRYLGDAEGLVREVWLLSPQEAAQSQKGR